MSAEHNAVFCSECANLLYPKADMREKKLYLECKNCRFRVPAVPPYCVDSTNFLATSTATTKGAHNGDITSDPTLPRQRFEDNQCKNCDQGFVLLYHTPVEETMALQYVCCNCNSTIDQKHMSELLKKKKDELALGGVSGAN